MNPTLDEVFPLDAEDPKIQLAAKLLSADEKLMSELIACRNAHGWSQEELGNRMGVSQASISAFERYDNDPRLSTIRRYALAVGARVQHRVSLDDTPAQPGLATVIRFVDGSVNKVVGSVNGQNTTAMNF